MSTVLAVNKNRTEAEEWNSQLRSVGHRALPICEDISSMINTLSNEKVHIVLCGAGAVTSDDIPVLKEAARYFPRVRIIMVQPVQKELKDFFGITYMNKFTPYVAPKVPPRESFKSMFVSGEQKEQSVIALLEDHFFTKAEAAAHAKRAFQAKTAGFAVLCVKTGAHREQAYDIAGKFASMTLSAYTVRFRPDELCVVLSGPKSEDDCLKAAWKLREALSAQTDAGFAIGVSRIRELPESLCICRREAQRAAASPVYGFDSVISVSSYGPNEIQYVYPSHKERRMIELTMDGNTEDALRLLDEIFEAIESCHDLRQSLVNKLALSITVNLNVAALARAYSLEKAQMDSLTLVKPLLAKTLRDAYAFLRQGIESFSAEMREFRNLRSDAMYMELCEMEGGALTVSGLIERLGVTLSFLNACVWKAEKSNIFAFIENKNRNL